MFQTLIANYEQINKKVVENTEKITNLEKHVADQICELSVTTADLRAEIIDEKTKMSNCIKVIKETEKSGYDELKNENKKQQNEVNKLKDIVLSLKKELSMIRIKQDKSQSEPN